MSAVLLTVFVDKSSGYINPTGTYTYVGKTEIVDGESYGYTGEIQVKTLAKKKIAMTFHVNKGAPSYNSGSFVDTLSYLNNKATWRDPAEDSTCKITFYFTKTGVTVIEETADFNSGCGFGHAVVAKGFFKKTSSETPVLVDPINGDELESNTIVRSFIIH